MRFITTNELKSFAMHRGDRYLQITMPLFDLLDDFDHFKTRNSAPSGSSCTSKCDDPSSRMAMKHMINALDRRDTMFLGDLSAVAALSIERTEVLVDHLVSVGAISRLTIDELRKLGLMDTSIVVKIQRRVCESIALAVHERT